MKSYKSDPYALTAKFKSCCAKCGKTIQSGEQAYYWPRTKKIMCTNCGELEYNQFLAMAMDEDIYNGYNY